LTILENSNIVRYIVRSRADYLLSSYDLFLILYFWRFIMKTIITAAALLIASSTVSANWDMPFMGNGSNANNTALTGNGIADTAGNGSHKGTGSADGEGEFTFAMSFKGRGTAKADSDTTAAYNGKANADVNTKADTAANSATHGVVSQ